MRYVLAVVLFPILAFAADAAPAVQPVWATILIAVAPFLISGLVALHPLMKLGSFFHEKAQDAKLSAVARSAMLGGESLAKSLDHFLEVEQKDFKDLIDPATRAAALKHMEGEAKSEALPALGHAAEAMGAGWVTGAASQVIDAAVAKVAAAPASPQ